MAFYILIRGPLGIGKSTISERLAQKLGAELISIDPILEAENLEEWEDGYISLESFLRTNEFAEKRARTFLEKGTPVIFDGNFYHRSQIDDLIARLNFSFHVFTLKAPLKVRVERDRRRARPLGREAAQAVYAKSTEFEHGIGINAARTIDSIVSEIVGRISERGGTGIGARSRRSTHVRST
jgi:predicted kinase